MKLNQIVFNDSHQSDGFEQAVGKINVLLKDAGIPTQIKTTFLDDYCDEDGEFAWRITLNENSK